MNYKLNFLFEQVILLWGDSGQVLAAQKLLQQLINKSSSSLQNKKPLWAKINAYSIKKEVEIFRDEQQDVILQQLRRAPELTIHFSEKVRKIIETFTPWANSCDCSCCSFGLLKNFHSKNISVLSSKVWIPSVKNLDAISMFLTAYLTTSACSLITMVSYKKLFVVYGLSGVS